MERREKRREEGSESGKGEGKMGVRKEERGGREREEIGENIR